MEELHEFEEDSNADSSSEESMSDDGDKPDKIMSMFSSYYGMEAEEEEEPQEDENAGAMEIDSPNFNANLYVKDLLLKKHSTDLIGEDTRMIHEIRSLDSDMQMLVYENYNKFISATETIKRMKNNVEAMEEDMVSVKVKTISLSDNAVQLDSNLRDKRAEVDKLVKVRKLLQKLEFLSELPEKLSHMIQQEKYKEAVELYNRTISVLMKHSNVLSFRNIQARTEQMMKDLRVMVTGLLDNSSALEVVKLTQYVTTLRLMEAPKRQVIEKFISAHKVRWTELVTKYAVDALGCDSMPPLASVQPIYMVESNSIGSKQRPTMLAVRQFHQTIISGLMEACKGVKEMFQQIASLNISARLDATEPEVDVAEIEEREAIHAHQQLEHMIRVVMLVYSNAVVVSLQRFFSEYHQFLHANAHLATADFQLDNKLASLFSSSSGSGSRSSKSPVSEEGGDREIPADMYAAIDVYKQQLSDWNEERNNWVILLRQMIVEVQCLDESVEDCRCFAHTTISPRASVDDGSAGGAQCIVVANPFEHSDCFSQLVVELVVDGLNVSWFNYYVDMYMCIFSGALPQFQLLCYLKAELASKFPNIIDGTGVKSINSTASTGSQRSQIPDRSAVAHDWQTLLGNAFFSCFSLLCADVKPIFDVMNVLKGSVSSTKPSLSSVDARLKQYVRGDGAAAGAANSAKTQSSAVASCGTFDAAFEERECKGNGNGNGAATLMFGHQLRTVGGFMSQYCRALAFRLERLCELSYRRTVICLGAPVSEDTGGDWDCEIYEELSTKHTTVTAATTDSPTNNSVAKDEDADFYNRINNEIVQKKEKAERDLLKKNADSGSDCDTSLKDCRQIASNCSLNALISYFILSRIYSDSVSTRLCESLQATDCPIPASALQQQASDYILFSSRRLLIFYNEACVQYTNALIGSHVMYMHNKVMTRAMESKPLVGLEEEDWTARAESFHRGEIAVSNSALAVVSALDVIALFNCVIFDDTPPAVKSAPSIESRAAGEGRAASRKSLTPNSAAAAQARQTQQNQLKKSTMGLQQDIDRLFSEKILICNYESVVSNPGNSSVLSVIAKVVLKNFQEHLRTLHFHADPASTGGFSTANCSGYVMLQLQVDLLFLKQAYMYLLKDTGETDRLVDQCISVLTGRCCTHTHAAEEDYSMVNMVENVNGNSELSRAVTDAVFRLSKKCALISR